VYGVHVREIKGAVEEGYGWIAGLADLRNVTYVDLPTSHWPMWPRPKELAAVIRDLARGEWCIRRAPYALGCLPGPRSPGQVK
jgi:hypothetical protein